MFLVKGLDSDDLDVEFEQVNSVCEETSVAQKTENFVEQLVSKNVENSEEITFQCLSEDLSQQYLASKVIGIMKATAEVIQSEHKSADTRETGLKRELSGLSENSFQGLTREPSFVYDTTVEAFSAHGASVDDLLNAEDENDVNTEEPEGISIIGKLVIGLSGGNDDFQESGQLTQVSIADISSSPGEPMLSVEGTEMEGTGVAIPGDRKQVSLYQETISTTPEAEDYFMKREQSFIGKIVRGEVSSLAVEVSDSFNPSNSGKLCVKPISRSSYSEIEISNLDFKSDLIVKPVDEKLKTISSYETIYDHVALEEIAANRQISIEELLGNLGDRFEGTRLLPEQAFSSEELYQGQADASSDLGVNRNRWSAPPGSLDPPDLEDQFTIQFDLVEEQGQEHWQELDIILGSGG